MADDGEDFWIGHPGDDSAFGVVLRFDSESRVAYLSARAPAGLLLSLLSDEEEDSILEVLRAEAAFDLLPRGSRVQIATTAASVKRRSFV